MRTNPRFLGSWITALSPFVVAASQTYAGACGFVVLLSVGEMIWSPRWAGVDQWFIHAIHHIYHVFSLDSFGFYPTTANIIFMELY